MKAVLPKRPLFGPCLTFGIVANCWMCPLDRILLNSWSVSQTAGTNGGVPSATAGMCRHAEVALRLLQAGKLKEAEPVSFGEGACAFEGFEECVAQAAEKRLLSDEDARNLLKIGVDAKANGVWFLVKLDDWGYAVREGRDRSCELGWAHVKDDNPKNCLLYTSPSPRD